MRSVIFLSIFLMTLFVGCTKAPITNRYQMITMATEEEIALGERYANTILRHSKISDDFASRNMVERVGKKIADIVDKQYNTQYYNWEFHLIESHHKANAFCLSGGKVFVYTPILKYIDSEDELAVIIGHEIAHALARHGAERKTSEKVTSMGNKFVDFLIGIDRTSIPIEKMWQKKITKEFILESILLPHSRTQEYEADKIGLVLSSKAGYDPKVSLNFWKKFSEESSSKPEYLSTHPLPIHRIEALQREMPFFYSFYQQAKNK